MQTVTAAASACTPFMARASFSGFTDAYAFITLVVGGLAGVLLAGLLRLRAAARSCGRRAEHATNAVYEEVGRQGRGVSRRA
jgi:hypothetical protein